jgi:hypothetical protein
VADKPNEQSDGPSFRHAYNKLNTRAIEQTKSDKNPASMY